MWQSNSNVEVKKKNYRKLIKELFVKIVKFNWFVIKI